MVADTLILPGSDREFSENERYAVEADDSVILPQLYFSTRDAFGRPVSNQKLWVLKRAAQKYNLKSGERSGVVMETRIRKLASQLRMPTQIATRAIYLRRKAAAMGLFRKPGLNDLGLAYLLAACREIRYVITIDDLIGTITQDEPKFKKRSKRKVLEYYNAVSRALKLKVSRPTVENYVTYFAGKLGINGPLITRAIRIAQGHRNPNSTPHCVAAAAVYISMRNSGINISQKHFCTCVNLSEISLRAWVNTLGGFKEPVRENGNSDFASLGDDPYDLQYQNRDGKDGGERAEERREPPPAPEQAEDEDDEPKRNKPHKNRVPAVKKVRQRRKIDAHPRRLPNLFKPRTKARKKRA